MRLASFKNSIRLQFRQLASAFMSPRNSARGMLTALQKPNVPAHHMPKILRINYASMPLTMACVIEANFRRIPNLWLVPPIAQSNPRNAVSRDASESRHALIVRFLIGGSISFGGFSHSRHRSLRVSSSTSGFSSDRACGPTGPVTNSWKRKWRSAHVIDHL